MISEEIEKMLLSKSIENVFKTMMGYEVSYSDNDEGGDISKHEHYTATIGFAGGWNGFVSITCSTDTAKFITSLLLGLDSTKVTCEDIRDAIGEVANMVGGRFKSLFSELQNSGKEVFKMSIPSVIQGIEYNIFAPADSGNTKVVVNVKDGKLVALLALQEDSNSK